MEQCTAITSKGTPCKAWAVQNSNPPRCAAHGGGIGHVGAPPGNANAATHGFYTCPARPLTSIDDIIADLAAKQARLSEYIDDHLGDIGMEEIKALLTLHAMTASRLGKLLRDKRALSGDAADGITGALAAALAELSTELGADFLGESL
jgi:hypothetical protein